MKKSKSLSGALYSVSRAINKTASTINDIETISSCNPRKICKRAKRKTAGKILNKITRNIINKL